MNTSKSTSKAFLKVENARELRIGLSFNNVLSVPFEFGGKVLSNQPTQTKKHLIQELRFLWFSLYRQ